MSIDFFFIIWLVVISFFAGIEIIDIYVHIKTRRNERLILYSCGLTTIIWIVYLLSRILPHFGWFTDESINHPQILTKSLSYISVSISMILFNILFSVIWEEKNGWDKIDHSIIKTFKVMIVWFICLTSMVFTFPEGCYSRFVAPIFAIWFVSIVLYVLIKHSILTSSFVYNFWHTQHKKHTKHKK